MLRVIFARANSRYVGVFVRVEVVEVGVRSWARVREVVEVKMLSCFASMPRVVRRMGMMFRRLRIVRAKEWVLQASSPLRVGPWLWLSNRPMEIWMMWQRTTAFKHSHFVTWFLLSSSSRGRCNGC